MNKSILVLSLLALSGLSSIAAAADDNWFVRGEVGQSRLSVNGFSGSNNDTSLGVRGGYYFTPNFAVEGAYTNYGTPIDDGMVNTIKLDAWALGVVAKKDFGPNNTGFFIDGRLGLSFNKTKASSQGQSVSDNSTDGYVGVGLGWDFNRNFGLGLNYDYTKAKAFGFSGHVSTVTGGLEARF